LFPGEWGGRVLQFIHQCRKPLITTFHKLPARPDSQPRRIVQSLADHSHAIVVSTKIAARQLSSVYGVNGARVHVIPRGVPVVPFERNPRLKAHLGLAGRKIICSFGLLDRRKGLEAMIEAMPTIVAACPDALYLILGVTDPLVLREEGEAYRESLVALAGKLGVSGNVRFLNKHLALESLIEHLRACDLCATPSIDKEQVSSSTLANALAAVGAVVSTPSAYAEEVLANGRGLLVPFGDHNALAEAAIRFLTDIPFREATRRKAFEYSRQISWPTVGRQHLQLYSQLVPKLRRAPSELFAMAPSAVINSCG
jgi:glycosyltransferase involved in cell wall biosynthesis